jgi:hypothetical protein
MHAAHYMHCERCAFDYLSAMLRTAVALAACAFAAGSTQPPPNGHACLQGTPNSSYGLPFCNSSLPISHRVEDLVARLTIDEKVSCSIHTCSGIVQVLAMASCGQKFESGEQWCA